LVDFFVIFLVILAHFSNILKNISKLFEQWQKNDNALRKMHNLCNLQNCHCFFLWLFDHFCAILPKIWTKIKKYSEIDKKGQCFEKKAIFATCKMTKHDKQNDRPKL
jgi:hypothetical protein